MKTRAYVETGFPGNAVADGLLLFEFCGLFQLRVWMSTSSNQWYVEMSAGITLGPMPFDAVVELVETSAIIRDDRVREGSSRDWKSVHQVPGLFADKLTSGSDSGAASLPSFEVAKPAGESTTGEQVKSEKTAPATAAAGGVVGLEGFELLLGELETASAFDVDDPASAGLPADASLEAAEPTAICPSKVKPQIRVEEGQGEASRPRSRLEVPDDVIPQLDITAPTPLKVPSAEPAASRTLCVPESSSIFTERETAEADARDARLQLNPAVLVSEGVKDEAAPAPQISVAALPQLKPTIQPWRPPTNRLKQLTVRGCLALAAVVGAWLLSSLLTPDMEIATYHQYASIYQEYQTFAELSDSSNWSQFATRAKAELDESLSDLEAVSAPGEHSKSLLLYAGRDLRIALDLNPGVANPHAERLAGFFEQLNALHDSGE